MFWTEQAPVFAAWSLVFLAASWLPPRSWQAPAQTLVGLGLAASISPVAAATMAMLGYWSARLPDSIHEAVPASQRAYVGERVLAAGLFWRLERAAYRIAVLAAFITLSSSGGFGPDTWIGTAGFGFAACRLWSLARVPRRAAGPMVRLHYLSFAPLLMAGPIEPFAGFRHAEARRRWSAEIFADGLERVLLGVVQAQVLGAWLVGLRLSHALAGLPQGWLVHLLAGIQPGLLLYCQFAGASSVAIGVACCAGFEGLQENFRSPLLSRDPVDFWTRWHRTLAAWCRQEVFDPVVAVTRNPWLGSIASMLVMGLWHAGTLPYAIWGIVQGVLVGATHAWQRRWPGPPRGPLAVVSCVLTVVIMMLSFRIAAAPSLAALVANIAGWWRR